MWLETPSRLSLLSYGSSSYLYILGHSHSLPPSYPHSGIIAAAPFPAEPVAPTYHPSQSVPFPLAMPHSDCLFLPSCCHQPGRLARLFRKTCQPLGFPRCGIPLPHLPTGVDITTVTILPYAMVLEDMSRAAADKQWDISAALFWRPSPLFVFLPTDPLVLLFLPFLPMFGALLTNPPYTYPHHH